MASCGYCESERVARKKAASLTLCLSRQEVEVGGREKQGVGQKEKETTGSVTEVTSWWLICVYLFVCFKDDTVL